ncbi:hypothetical protein CHS0354_018066 [Potamilus streckersoni]|uniref:Cadherin domain-containing protein n=1 Tax=Potamilus streckersoni TaxID=2493646 RepID=A0AAE0S343_9BIVA|nr:hypothetical protein CHS0354_018066 [Potamilus streckersoni]
MDMHEITVGMDMHEIAVGMDMHEIIAIMDMQEKFVIMDMQEITFGMDMQEVFVIMDMQEIIVIMDMQEINVIMDMHEITVGMDMHEITVGMDMYEITVGMDMHEIIVIMDMQEIIVIMDMHEIIVIMDMHEIIVIMDMQEITVGMDMYEITVGMDMHEIIVIMDMHEITVGLDMHEMTLTFVAIDSGFPRLTSRPANLTINVIRNKNPPVFINEPYIVEVSRNLVRNIEVYVVSATDADIQSPYNVLTYSIIGDDAATTYFQINSASGSITVKEPFVNDAASTYHIRVFVQDGGSPYLSDTAIVTVNIRRNLDTPRFNPVEYTRTIFETQALGVPIIRLTATDSDTTAPYNMVNYVLEGDATTLGYFILDTGTGDVSLKKSVYSTNSSVPSLFRFQARAFNPGFPESFSIIRANVTVIIVRNNNAPRFLQLPYQRTINENHNPGSSVFQTSAVDDDTMSPFGDLDFRLIGDDSGPGYFSIDQSGLITLNANTDLRLDPDTQYQLRVEVRDGGIPARSATALVAINVVKNLFSPQFNITNVVQIIIPETTPIGTKLLDLAAYDLDRQAPENTITFSLSSASNIADFFFINPRTGQVFLTTSVLNVATSFFQFQVLARDGGTPTRQTATTVSITVTRETGRLTFALPSYAIVISETTANNVVVIRTVASPGTPTYRILTSSPIDQTYFNISRNTGDILVNGNLLTDPQQLTFFFLVIEASASGSLSTQTATATVNITVTRNARAPRFLQDVYIATIRDITVPGTQVLQVSAFDQDVGVSF